MHSDQEESWRRTRRRCSRHLILESEAYRVESLRTTGHTAAVLLGVCFVRGVSLFCTYSHLFSLEMREYKATVSIALSCPYHYKLVELFSWLDASERPCSAKLQSLRLDWSLSFCLEGGSETPPEGLLDHLASVRIKPRIIRPE